MLLCVICGLCVEVDGNCGVVGYCVGSGGDLLWVIVWGVMVIFMCYCVGSGGDLLWVIVWGGVVICYRLLCRKWR